MEPIHGVQPSTHHWLVVTPLAIVPYNVLALAVNPEGTQPMSQVVAPVPLVLVPGFVNNRALACTMQDSSLSMLTAPQPCACNGWQALHVPDTCHASCCPSIRPGTARRCSSKRYGAGRPFEPAKESSAWLSHPSNKQRELLRASQWPLLARPTSSKAVPCV